MTSEPPPPRPRRWPIALGLVLTLIALLVAALWASLYTQPGTRLLLQQLPGLTVSQPRGALLGGEFSADRIVWTSADRTQVEIDAFAWRGLTWQRKPYASAWLGLRLAELNIERVTVDSPPPPDDAKPLTPPTSLRLPLELQIDRLRIGRLQIGPPSSVPIEGIEARLHLGADAGATHIVDRLRLAREPVVLGTGSLRIGSDAPFPMQASAELASIAGAPVEWSSKLDLQGPLQRLQASATLAARGMSADARATLLPFAAWPLPALDATTRRLDLSALVAAAPATSIDAQVHVETEGLSQPARIDVEINNAAPGRIDAGRLPVQRVAITANARLDRPQQIDASSVAIEFAADTSESAGRFDGKVGLDGERLVLDGRIAGLRPERLDSRAAAVALDGPLAARIDGLGSTNRFDVQATLDGVLARSTALQSAQVKSAKPRPANTASPAPAGTAKPPAGSTNSATLSPPIKRQLDAAGTAIKLQLDVAGTASDIELRRIAAHAGDAGAELSGRLQRPDAQTLLATGRAKLDRFDPLPFWPGRDDSPLRRGPHRINAESKFDLRIAPPAQPSLDAWLTALQGNATLTLADGSRLAGVPVSGSATVDADRARVQASLAFEAAGNRARVKGTAVAGAGAADRWQIELNAPALGALAPLVKLTQQAGAPPPLRLPAHSMPARA